MLNWFVSNLSTILITIALAAIVVFISIYLIRRKKQGKSSCGGNCGACPMGGSCHTK